ncbi:hypothetical protein KY338_05210 [Candidatus Woesearchaeota archaeon]|nr:hypothetical protein [Candidatus Woesearchaeota archaeon]MBW3005549.1 hypothetical protein [Candidatus Woesearchaeota archaeon]
MKKAVILFVIFVILSINAAALKIVNTHADGKNPVIYGSTVAFETAESDLGTDLNNDGDTNDKVIRYYNVDSGDIFNTEIAGKNPTIFAQYIAFESSEKDQNADLNADNDTNDNIILYYSLRDKKVISTTAEGKTPSLFGDYIAFSTPAEKIRGIDYNNDGDQEDEIIKLYKISTKELTNTKAAGMNPAVSDKYIIFETLEKDEDKDLNNDDDKNDIVLRYYIMESGKTLSSFTPGQKPNMNEESVAVFTSYDNGDSIYYYSVATEELKNTEVKGNTPSITNNLISFIQDEKLAVYDTDKSAFAVTDVYGANPTVFENKLAFSTNEALTGDLNNDGDSADSVIRIVIGEDLDNDGVYDFADNCPDETNENQTDKDRDGIGDACDEDTKKAKEAEETKENTDEKAAEEEAKQTTLLSEDKEETKAEKTSEPKPLPEPKSFTMTKKKGPGFFTWLLILLAILAGAGCVIYAAIFGLGKRKRKFKF